MVAIFFDRDFIPQAGLNHLLLIISYLPDFCEWCPELPCPPPFEALLWCGVAWTLWAAAACARAAKPPELISWPPFAWVDWIREASVGLIGWCACCSDIIFEGDFVVFLKYYEVIYHQNTDSWICETLFASSEFPSMRTRTFCPLFLILDGYYTPDRQMAKGQTVKRKKMGTYL